MIPRHLATAAIAAVLTLAATARADYFSPHDFASGGAFPAGSVTIDTSLLTVNGGAWLFASVEPQGPGLPDVAVFTFDRNDSLTSGVTLVGSRPAVILFRGRTTAFLRAGSRQ